jgi:hypothetical protein
MSNITCEDTIKKINLIIKIKKDIIPQIIQPSILYNMLKELSVPVTIYIDIKYCGLE